ncbi:hypothetical protein A6J80_18410 [Paracoccus yeei]|uniref:Uncharacterized protein n=1 Tax=Paracoccus yeei TaxID=147645 RepID=A0A1V0GWN4_9RHOB|nr:hypothetical protein A6J80_18410 [Paracoccus yeei]
MLLQREAITSETAAHAAPAYACHPAMPHAGAGLGMTIHRLAIVGHMPLARVGRAEDRVLRQRA